MPTKQELMHMMDNRLPGETLPLRDGTTEQSSTYPDLERVSYASQQHMDHQKQQQQEQFYIQQQQQQQEQTYRPEPVYTIPQATVISKYISFKNFSFRDCDFEQEKVQIRFSKIYLISFP